MSESGTKVNLHDVPSVSLMNAAIAVGASRPDLDQEVDFGTLLAAAADNRSPKEAAEAFWVQGPVDLTRWGKLYPYQLLVVRAVAGPDGKATFKPEATWAYTFAIPPEGLTTGMPFASQLAATLGGVVSEEGGAPFRMFSLRGTTGMLPGRAKASQQGSAGFFETIAGGTVAQLSRAEGDLQETLQSLTGTSPSSTNVHPLSDFEFDETTKGPDALLAKTTGYYQLMRLQYFLEAYAAIKKTPAGRDLRLAFAQWKKRQITLVKPVSYDTQKSGESGMEESFTLTMQGYRRIELEAGGFRPQLPPPTRRDPSALARGLNTLIAARRTIQSLTKVADAVVGDANRLLFEPLRQATLLTKDLQGLSLSLAELPDELVRSCKDSYIRLQGELLAEGGASSQTVAATYGSVSAAGAAASELNDMTGKRGNMTAQQARMRALQAHPASQPFQDPRASFDLFSQVSVDKLKLSVQLRQLVGREAAVARGLRRSDFEVMRDQVSTAASRLATALGAGDPTFEATYGGSDVHRVKDEPTDSDWEALYALNESIIYLDSLAATADGEPSAVLERMDAMAQLARGSGIAFRVPRSKFAVPFPYGSTLETLSLTYLGTPDRWHEIAALNGLREPYIDEVGFDLPLLANGHEHQVVVADSTRLYVGQACYIWSTQSRRTRRRILGLRVVGSHTVVTLDGVPDLDAYRIDAGALLSAFQPDTVNSQSLVYIPSDREPLDDDAITKDIPGIDEFDPMVAAAGVDLLLDQTNDLVITPDGDTRFAAGLTTVLQYVRTALSVQRGTLLHHQDFGLPFAVGDSTADFNAPKVVDAVRRMFAEDPTIARVTGVRVSKSGPHAEIQASIVVQGTDRPVPLRFDVDRSFGQPTAANPTAG